MLAELRAKSQITVPREIVTKLGLSEGDKLEVLERDGTIYLVPVVVYPKAYVDALEKEASETAEQYRQGKISAFATPEELIASLHATAEAHADSDGE
jgi:AbrB family looped-hinge helix DNA binding protein